MATAPFLGDNEVAPPKFKTLKPEQEPIDLLTPGSDHHKFVLEYILKRIRSSEEQMTKFYSRWQVAERKIQAYLTLPDYEQMLKDMNDKSAPPAPAIILFPYNFASISTIVTYCMKVYCSKKPFTPLGANGKEAADNVKYMEAMLQYQYDMNKMIMRIFQLLLDGELYGLGVVRNIWAIKRGKRRVIRPPNETERLSYANNPQDLPALLKDYEEKVIYAGNETMNIDPFMFFPDPNVPMAEVSEKGEFVFWREYVGKHILLEAERAGALKYVRTIEPGTGSTADDKWYNLSHRSAISGGNAHAGGTEGRGQTGLHNSYKVDQGSCTIIPLELGLGPEDYPVKYLFTILNKTQIVQAEPLDMDHGRHPVEVSEPYSLGYGFGQPSLSDYISPIQDILSWFIDSHIYNVRASLNNQWLYDPSKIDETSLKYPQPGKHIRLKPLAYGTDVRAALTQFPVNDVTRGHISDLATFLKIGDMVSSVNDSMRGTPTAGRRTAADARMTNESGFGRLSVHAQLISQMCLTRLTDQYVLNIQQFQEEDQWLKVIGQESYTNVGAQLLMGNFTYTVHDGTLPLDRIGSFDTWKEILMGMAQSPILSRSHSLPRIFEHVCALGGAPNITSFRLVSDTELDQMAKAGNAVPLPEAAAGLPNAA